MPESQQVKISTYRLKLFEIRRIDPPLTYLVAVVSKFFEKNIEILNLKVNVIVELNYAASKLRLQQGQNADTPPRINGSNKGTSGPLNVFTMIVIGVSLNRRTLNSYLL